MSFANSIIYHKFQPFVFNTHTPFIDAIYQMLSLKAFLILDKKICMQSLPYMGMAAIMTECDHLNKLSITYPH